VFVIATTHISSLYTAPCQLTHCVTSLIRDACNEPHFRPIDVFRRLYGYACGAAGSSRSCEDDEGKGTGSCPHGPKNRQYLLDDFRAAAFDGCAASGKEQFIEFGRWLLSAMLESMFLHSVCLDSDLLSCPNGVDDQVFTESLEEMQLAALEVSDNIERAQECFCRCKKVTLTEIFIDNDGDDLNDAFGYVEVRAFFDNALVWPTSSQGSVKYGDELYGTLSLPGANWRSVYSARSVVKEPGSILRIAVEEWDQNENDRGFADINSADWYEPNNCASYKKVFALSCGSGGGCDNWKFHITFDPL